jgi:dUTP pyrophosphatase
MYTITEPRMIVELVHPNAKMPTRAHASDAGMDVYTPQPFMIGSRSHSKISLGWCCEIPEGWVLLVFNKSGHAVNKGLDKGAECIDSGYRGEVHVHLFNHSFRPVEFDTGDKIAQVLLIPIWTGQPIEGKVNINTSRGVGGFGSTGLQ